MDINQKNMKIYIVGHANINMKPFLLYNEAYTCSKTIYLDAMEAKVRYQPILPTKFEQINAQYKSWHQYVTTELQVEVVELEFPSTKA